MIPYSVQGLVAAILALALAIKIIDKLIDRALPPKTVVPADVMNVIEPLVKELLEGNTKIKSGVNSIVKDLAPDEEGVQRWKSPGIRRELDKQTAILVRIDSNIARLADNNPGSGGGKSL